MTLKDKRVFITGATGFIGRALALRLLEEGAGVVGLTRNPAKGTFLASSGVEMVQGDVTDHPAMRELVAGAEVVFHLTAVAGTSGTAAMQAVNVEGTRNVLDAAHAAGVERFVHVSTMAVYGYDRRGVVDETARLGDTGDIYGDTKAIGEGLVRRADLPWSVVRPGQVYGPRSPSWTVRLFQATRWFVPLVDGGRGACHPIYIDDLVDLLILAATHPAAPGEVFNGSPDPASTWLAFLGAYGRMHGHTRYLDVPRWLLTPPLAALDWLLPLAGYRLPARAMLDFAAGQVTYTHRKAREMLGWEPRVNLDEGMRRAEAWLRAEGYL